MKKMMKLSICLSAAMLMAYPAMAADLPMNYERFVVKQAPVPQPRPKPVFQGFPDSLSENEGSSEPYVPPVVFEPPPPPPVVEPPVKPEPPVVEPPKHPEPPKPPKPPKPPHPPKDDPKDPPKGHDPKPPVYCFNNC